VDRSSDGYRAGAAAEGEHRRAGEERIGPMKTSLRLNQVLVCPECQAKNRITHEYLASRLIARAYNEPIGIDCRACGYPLDTFEPEKEEER
jgi:hypothetical protein